MARNGHESRNPRDPHPGVHAGAGVYALNVWTSAAAAWGGPGCQPQIGCYDNGFSHLQPGPRFAKAALAPPQLALALVVHHRSGAMTTVFDTDNRGQGLRRRHYAWAVSVGPGGEPEVLV